MNSTAFGNLTQASGEDATAFGYYNTASGYASTAFGYYSTAGGPYATAFGYNTSANGLAGTTFGVQTQANGQAATAFGQGSKALAIRATAFGSKTEASGATSTAFGQQTKAIGDLATAFGGATFASGIGSTAFGNSTVAAGDYSTAFGVGSKAYGLNSLAALGGTTGEGTVTENVDAETGKVTYTINVTEPAQGALAIGEGALAQKNYTYAIGQNASVTVANGIAFGNGASVTTEGGVAIGAWSVSDRAGGMQGANPLEQDLTPEQLASPTWTSTAGAFSVGGGRTKDGAVITRQITNVAAGTNDTDAVNVAQLRGSAAHYYSVSETEPTGQDLHTIDNNNKNNTGATGAGSLAAGFYAHANGDEATAFGYNSVSEKTSSSSLGSMSKATADYATAVGHSATAAGEKSTALGSDSLAADLNSSAMGLAAKAYGEGAITIGHEATSGVLVKVSKQEGTEGTSAYYTTEVVTAEGKNGETLVIRTLNTEIDPTERVVENRSGTKGTRSLKTTPLLRGDAKADSGSNTISVVAYDSLKDKYYEATLGEDGKYVIGREITVNPEELSKGGVSVGSYAYASGERSLSVGRASGAYGPDSTAMGIYANARGEGSIAIGHGSSAGVKTTVIPSGPEGTAERADGLWTTAIQSDDQGSPVFNGNAGGIAIGSYAHTEGTRAMAVGRVAGAYGMNSTAVGLHSFAYGEGSMAFGHGVVAGNAASPDARVETALHNDPDIEYSLDGGDSVGVDLNNVIGAIALGSYAETTARASLSVGRYTTARSAYSTAIGIRAAVGMNSRNALAIGRESIVADDSENAIAIGEEARASGIETIGFGHESEAYGRGSIAIGHLSTTGVEVKVNSGDADDFWTTEIIKEGGAPKTNDSVAGIAIGNYAHALGTRAMAIGRVSGAYGMNSTVVGLRTNAYGEGSMAFGHGVVAGNPDDPYAKQIDALHDDPYLDYDLDGNDEYGVKLDKVIGAIAMGSYAEATGSSSLSVGRYSKAQSAYSTALGIRATVGEGAHNSLAIGRESNVGDNSVNAIAIGKMATVTSSDSIAIGKESTVTGSNSIAIGSGHQISGNRSGAFGDPIKITDADDAYAIGNGSEITPGANGSFILGNDATVSAAGGVALGNNTSVTKEGGVALGAGSVADRAAYENDIEAPFSKVTLNADNLLGAISVGGNGKLRQITNVGDGVEDTDAVNIRQLKNVTLTAGENVEIGENNSINVVGGTKYAGDFGDTLSLSLDTVLNVKGNAASEKDLTDGNIGVVTDPDNGALLVKLNKDVNLGENGSLTIIGGPSDDITISRTNINVGGNRITNVAAGVDDTDTVNVSQLKQYVESSDTSWNLAVADDKAKKISKGNTVRIVVEKNDPVGDLTTDVLSVKETSNDQGERVVSFKVLDAPTFGGEVRAGGLRVKAKEGDVVISETGINAGGNKITNVGKGDISEKSTDAVNGTQLYDLGESLAQSLGTSQVEGGGSKFDKNTGKVSFKVNFDELDSETTVVSALRALDTKAVYKHDITLEKGLTVKGEAHFYENVNMHGKKITNLAPRRR